MPEVVEAPKFSGNEPMDVLYPHIVIGDPTIPSWVGHICYSLCLREYICLGFYFLSLDDASFKEMCRAVSQQELTYWGKILIRLLARAEGQTEYKPDEFLEWRVAFNNLVLLDGVCREEGFHPNRLAYSMFDLSKYPLPGKTLQEISNAFTEGKKEEVRSWVQRSSNSK